MKPRSILPVSLFLFILFTFLPFFFPASSFAQNIPAGINGLTLTASNDNPVPGSKVIITATSYSFDIDTATVVWTLNGKQVQKGIGLTEISLAAPAQGKKTAIEVTAMTPDGGSATNEIMIGSGSVDLVVETDGYVPPFFLGKAPLVFQNNVKVVAMPHLSNSAGVEYDPASLIYEWKKDDGTVLNTQSGYGKQAITLKGNIVPRPYYLIVTASSRDGSAQGQSLIQILPHSPTITFYNDDPLYGPMFNKSIGNVLYLGAKHEVSALAALFGFNVSAGDPVLGWLINSTEHPELASSETITLRTAAGTGGTSEVKVSARGTDNILQSANAAFSVIFNASASQGSSAVSF